MPVQIPFNCNNEFNQGKYYLKIKSNENIEKKEIIINNSNKSICSKIIQKEVLIKENSTIKKETIEEYNKTQVIYSSKDLKQRKISLYFFSITLIFVIISLVIENGKQRNKSPRNNRSSRLS